MKMPEMKKLASLLSMMLLAVLLFNSSPQKAEASEWIGMPEGLIDGPGNKPDLAFDNISGEPYITFLDFGYSQVYVMKYDYENSTWSGVANPIGPISAASTPEVKIQINPSTNKPYIAFVDPDNANKITVKQYDGSSWLVVGSAGFTPSISAGLFNISINFNPLTNEPYVAFSDSANSEKVSVMRYNGSSWINVGSAGFSDGEADFISLEFNPLTNEPLVGFQDRAHNLKATVMKYNGSSWSTVGSAGFSTAIAVTGFTRCKLDMKIDPNGSIYFAYQEMIDDKVTIMKYNGSSWSNLGPAKFSNGLAGDISLSLDPTDDYRPYVAYIDGANSNKLTVRAYDENSWINNWLYVGSPGFTASSVTNPTLRFNDDGDLFISANNSQVMTFSYDTVTTPAASISSGLYSSTQSIVLTTGNALDKIYYTLDGSDPTTSSTPYNSPISISSTTTLKAMATRVLLYDSDVMSETYTINPTSSVYRFWSDQKQGHFYTSSADERDYIIANYPENVWRYENVAYASHTSQAGELTPVYRFWSNEKQHHFYTASEDEKDYVMANYPEDVWKYESIAYYAYATEQPNTTAVYRFWSDQKQGHFYTASAEERDYITANYPENVWKYENVAWYVPSN